jgi:hypothetical protein
VDEFLAGVAGLDVGGGLCVLLVSDLKFGGVFGSVFVFEFQIAGELGLQISEDISVNVVGGRDPE